MRNSKLRMLKVATGPEVQQDEGRTGEGLPLVLAGKLLKKSYPREKWVWGNRLRVGGSSLWNSKPKVGKTTALTELGFRTARGDDFLGWETAQGPVILLLLEEHEEEVVDHLKRLELTDSDPIYLLATPYLGPDALSRLEASIKEIQPVLVVVDPLFDLLNLKDNDTNSYGTVRVALREVHNLARQTGTHIAATVHRGKGDRQGMDGIMGSTAFQAGVDTVVTLTKSGLKRFFSTEQRYPRGISDAVKNVPETELLFDPESGTTKFGRSRAVEVSESFQHRILSFLKDRPAPTTREEVENGVPGDVGPLRKALSKLVADGLVDKTGAGKKGDPFRYALAQA